MLFILLWTLPLGILAAGTPPFPANTSLPARKYQPIYHATLFRADIVKNEAAKLNETIKLTRVNSGSEPPKEDPVSASDVEEVDLDPEEYSPVVDKPVYVLHHPENDEPDSLYRDKHIRIENRSTPICTFFRHSVLGDDLGEATFPRVTFVSTASFPYHVHYAPDDELRYEAYKWPFAACNRACELQQLTIIALFDGQLDPTNENSDLDAEAKETLTLAREICQWKNAQKFFAFQKDDTTLEKRSDSAGGETDPDERDTTDSNKVSQAHVFSLSREAQTALQEIQGIFQSTLGPDDLARMFSTVIAACQIHRYTRTPMAPLQITSTDRMVQQAMRQVEQVFADTQGRINVWETRDAIVRATQIYRYQEEQSRSR